MTAMQHEGKEECPKCGGWYTVAASGELRKHKCSGEDEGLTLDGVVIEIGPTPDKPASTPRKVTVKKRKAAPPMVRKFAIAGIATGVENVTAKAIAGAVPCDVVDIPKSVVELPDPDAMIGPFIDFAWPKLPAKAQRFVSSIVDQADLIEAGILWWTWFTEVNTWKREAHQIMLDNAPPAPTYEGDDNVLTFQPANGNQAQAGGFTPFAPVTDLG